MTKTTTLTIKEYKLTIKAEQALSLEVKDNATLATSAEYLTEANRELDALTADKKKLTDPLNQSLKAIRLKYKTAEERLESVISYLRGQQSAYATQVEADKAKIADRIKEGKGNLSIEKGLERIEAIAVPQTTITENGSLKFRPHQKVKILDESIIPRKYLTVDEARILVDLKSGVVVAGCELETVMIPVNHR